MKRIISVIGALVLAACSNSNEHQAADDSPGKVQSKEPRSPVPPPGTGPNARTPLAEPKGLIDPKSAEAAGQVVQHYGALIEQGRWAEARKLWSNAKAAAEFEGRLKGDWSTHLEIGNPGNLEGAAGSTYVTMPVVFYNDRMRRPADVILRRVNDVPGSTEAQRRWHIERIEWKDA